MSTVRLFKHHFHTSFIWLGVSQWLLFILSVYLGLFFRFFAEDDPIGRYLEGQLVKAILFAFVGILCFSAMGLYRPRLREGELGLLVRTISAFGLIALVMSVLFYLLPGLLLWRGPLALSLAFAFLMTIISRAVFNRIVDEDRLKRRVLVYGAGNRAQQVLNRLRRKSDRRSFRFVGFIHVPHEEDVVDRDRIVNIESGDFAAYAKTNDVDEILIAVDDRRRGLPVDDLLHCKLNGVDVLDVVNFFEREVGKIMLEFVTPGWMIFADGFSFGSWRDFTKRTFDLVASFLVIMMTWPLMLLVVIAIWIEDGFKAPVVYRQQRVGLDSKPFYLLKFRSMKVDAEKDGKAVWAAENDNRITRVGHFIRACRLDELPQLINVLAGEMGIVGPRPERPEFVSVLEKEIPFYAARHQVKPGIAGWAQLCYPYGASVKDAEQKLQYDLYYVKNHSLFLDCLILLQTVEVVLMGEGVR